MFRRIVHSFTSRPAAETSIGKGITRGTRRPHRFDTEHRTELPWGSCAEIGKAEAGPFFRRLWQSARSQSLPVELQCNLPDVFTLPECRPASIPSKGYSGQANGVQQRAPRPLSAKTQCTRQQIARKYTHDDRFDAAPD